MMECSSHLPEALSYTDSAVPSNFQSTGLSRGRYHLVLACARRGTTSLTFDISPVVSRAQQVPFKRQRFHNVHSGKEYFRGMIVRLHLPLTGRKTDGFRLYLTIAMSRNSCSAAVIYVRGRRGWANISGHLKLGTISEGICSGIYYWLSTPSSCT